MSLSENELIKGILGKRTIFICGEDEKLSKHSIRQLLILKAEKPLEHLYFIKPPNDVIEFLRHLPIQNLQLACLEEDENVSYCANVPLKSCDDASSQSAILIFKEGNQSSIDYSGYCLEAESKSGEMLMVADRALFVAYGIMN